MKTLALLAAAALGIATAQAGYQEDVNKVGDWVVAQMNAHNITVGERGTCTVAYPSDTDPTKSIAAVLIPDSGDSGLGFAVMNGEYFDGQAAWIGDVHRDGNCWAGNLGKVCAWIEGAR